MVLGCSDLVATAAFFVDDLGMRLDAVFPADDPREMQVSGQGLSLVLSRDHPEVAIVLRIPGVAPAVAPNGVTIVGDRVHAVPDLVPRWVVAQGGGDHPGRAGMRYRDLIPDRQGGRFVASHISIPEGGPVADQIHHHEIRLQLIACLSGWVRVAYDGLAEPIVMRPGHVVLQPPGIRHQVLEASPGLEVLEVACPAAHDTRMDHDGPLEAGDPDRRWGGQRFAHATAPGAARPWWHGGCLSRPLGLYEPSGGLVEVREVTGPGGVGEARHDGELRLWYVTAGTLRIDAEEVAPDDLGPGAAIVVPPGVPHRIAGSTDLRLVEVAVGGRHR